MNRTPAVIALDERANIYVVLDGLGQTIGTGTKEVCEFLAQLGMKPTTAPNQSSKQPSRIGDNVRSAIKL